MPQTLQQYHSPHYRPDATPLHHQLTSCVCCKLKTQNSTSPSFGFPLLDVVDIVKS